MDILKNELSRLKRNIVDKGLVGPNKKYFRRSDLAAKEEEQYLARRKQLAPSSSDAQSETRPSTSGVPDEARPDTTEEKIQLSRKEVMRRLRERAEPVILFAETEAEAYQRLKKLEMLMPEVNRGFKNDMQDAMDQVDQDYLNEMLKSGGDNEQATETADVKVKDDGVTMDEILRKSKGLGKGDSGLDCEVMLKFLKLVLKKWGDSLNSRSAQEKCSLRGKLASATHTQTVSYIMPLFRKFKRRMVDEGILVCLVDIIAYLLDRNYLKANDAYLEMAIGNAPWPIGVTMVGIHARTGREKIFDRNVAHVLNDETQRKYIQALKRLMTQCQKFFPTDPSRSVNFESLNNN